MANSKIQIKGSLDCSIWILQFVSKEKLKNV